MVVVSTPIMEVSSALDSQQFLTRVSMQALFGTLSLDVMVLTVLYSIAGLGIAIVNDFKSIEGDRSAPPPYGRLLSPAALACFRDYSKKCRTKSQGLCRVC